MNPRTYRKTLPAIVLLVILAPAAAAYPLGGFADRAETLAHAFIKEGQEELETIAAEEQAKRDAIVAAATLEYEGWREECMQAARENDTTKRPYCEEKMREFQERFHDEFRILQEETDARMRAYGESRTRAAEALGAKLRAEFEERVHAMRGDARPPAPTYDDAPADAPAAPTPPPEGNPATSTSHVIVYEAPIAPPPNHETPYDGQGTGSHGTQGTWSSGYSRSWP